MQFFNNLLLKIQSTKLYKWFFGLFLFLFFFIPKVNASEILFGPGATFQIGSTITVSDTQNSLPYSGVVYANGSLNLGAIQVQYSGNSVGNPHDSPTYNWLYLNICASTASSYLTMNISNSSTLKSYFVSGAYKGVDTGLTCSTQGYNGKQYLFQIPIGKWEYGEYSEWFEVASYNSFTSTNGVYFTIDRVFLADEDITATYRTQQALQDKLNTINSAITNMQNSVNNNITQEFDDLKDMDHTYNNYPTDSVPNSNDVDSVVNAESSLMGNLDLSTNSLSVDLNTDSVNYIWDIVSRIRAIDPKITLLFTSILSLGIIKMVLNR